MFALKVCVWADSLRPALSLGGQATTGERSPGRSAESHKAAVKVLARAAASISRLAWDGSVPKLALVAVAEPGICTGKTIALTRWTFVGKVMSLLFNMLSRLVITFLPRSKRLLISWLQSPSAVIVEPRKIKSDTVSTVSPSISHEVMGP